ncbi:MAG: ferrochelatase [Thermincola sp.]|jgi:ferrochelatase|nr:ferrochelatase [Thermincola sp.]MDT3703184.1 ferrochelatase [Thermincola sp.]
MGSRKLGVLLLAFGGADSPEAIEPFMKNLMGGRVPPPPLVEKIKTRYQLIGGASPLPGITRLQADRLQAYLQQKTGHSVKAAVGMRFWHPFIEEGLQEILAAGVDQIVAVSLAPFYSKASTGTYIDELNRVITGIAGEIPKAEIADSLYNKPAYIAAAAEQVQKGLAELPEAIKGKTKIIFSAHSLPVSYTQGGDPYAEHFNYTAREIAAKLQLENWCTAYQSKGGGQGEWLGPMVEEAMDKAQKDGFSGILVSPVGFVSDHIETLYDVDIAQRDYARSLGLGFHRTASLNTSELFIKALAEVVLEKL